MSMATLERTILASARLHLNNPQLKMANILEWSSSEEVVKKNAQKGEVVLFVSDPGVWACVGKRYDLRKEEA